ncbi:MAG: class I SAM-dependent methyltransferase [Solirubrobacteraceae bacterium]
MSSERSVREFTRQAASFEVPGSPFADAGVLDWIAGHIAVRSGDRILDVAGGTGQLGRHLGRGARLCVVADITPAMLEQGAHAVRAENRNDVVFIHADATALPFPEAQFEVVVSRFALHHLSDIGAALREMQRVCTPGGSVTVTDMVTEPGSVGERMDQLERLRDPSHVACPRPAGLRELMTSAGLRQVGEAVRDERLPADSWLARAAPDQGARDAILEALRAETAGGAPTGLRAAGASGKLTITHRYLLLHASRA